jgi:hypothetical protein
LADLVVFISAFMAALFSRKSNAPAQRGAGAWRANAAASAESQANRAIRDG